MAELSVAFNPPSLKLRRALLAIHPHGKPWGFLAKESKKATKPAAAVLLFFAQILTCSRNFVACKMWHPQSG